LMVLGVFMVGAGLVFQATCNAALAEPLGSASKATLLTTVITLILSLPLWAGIQFGVGVQPILDLSEDWPLLLVAGALGALYRFSLAVLPETLGYTATSFMVLAGKLVGSSFADSYGLLGITVAFSLERACAVLCVLLGTFLFSLPRSSCLACVPTRPEEANPSPLLESFIRQVSESLDVDSKSFIRQVSESKFYRQVTDLESLDEQKLTLHFVATRQTSV